MNITRDLEFESELINRMAQAEFGGQRTGVHCTDLIYSLNKQALRRTNPIPTSRHDILLYALGWSSQRWLTGKAKDEDTITVDGIQVTLDALLVYPWELKCTYQGSGKPIEENQAWVRQVMSQCFVTKTTIAHLSRFELMGDWKSVFGKKEDKKLPEHEKPTLSAWRFEFTQAELDDHWAWMKSRRDLFLGLLADPSKLLPRAMSLPSADSLWECSYCNPIYKKLCGVE